MQKKKTHCVAVVRPKTGGNCTTAIVYDVWLRGAKTEQPLAAKDLGLGHRDS